MKPSLPIRVLALLAAGLVLIPAGGCDDDRESAAAGTTGFLDGDGIFGTAVVASTLLRYQNELAEKVLEIVENNLPTPITEAGCEGPGTRTFVRDVLNPSRVVVRHELSYQYQCLDPVRVGINGEYAVEIVAASPLHFRIHVPFNQLTGETEDLVNYQLPQDFGGAILDVSTPGQTVNPLVDPFGDGAFLDCTVESDGRLHVTGTLRFEERQQGILVVQELGVSYGYDSSVSPAFSNWPGGSYEIAALNSGGFTGPSSSAPVDVSFDGFGGVTFSYLGRSCDSNMATGENPCEDL